MEEYIVSRKDWDFASVVMGINMLSSGWTLEEFENRVDRLIFIDGLELLGRKDYISGDFTHPSFDGLESIIQRWLNIMMIELEL